MTAAAPFAFPRRLIMTKTTTKTATKKSSTKTAKVTTPGVQVKKDAQGRFWVVTKHGGPEQGPFDTKKQALDAKAGTPAADTKATKPAKANKTKEPKAKKVGALDAAAQVLAASKEPMNCKEMIETMAKKALWTSPGGKTPHATLYSAIIREIALKGKESRFVKKERGQFAAKV
jgi:hypothetical protein